MPDRPEDNSQWTDADWEQWFDDEVAKTVDWRVVFSRSDPRSGADDFNENKVPPALENMVETFVSLQRVSPARFFFPGRTPRDYAEGRIFSNQAPADRVAFYTAWAKFTSIDGDVPSEGSQRDLSLFETTVTMPDGTSVKVDHAGVDRSKAGCTSAGGTL